MEFMDSTEKLKINLLGETIDNFEVYKSSEK
jgi:hypothetical protein